MRSEKEIEHLLRQWISLKDMLEDCGDIVSLEVSKHADMYISTLKWVLE